MAQSSKSKTRTLVTAAASMMVGASALLMPLSATFANAAAPGADTLLSPWQEKQILGKTVHELLEKQKERGRLVAYLGAMQERHVDKDRMEDPTRFADLVGTSTYEAFEDLKFDTEKLGTKEEFVAAYTEKTLGYVEKANEKAQSIQVFMGIMSQSLFEVLKEKKAEPAELKELQKLIDQVTARALRNLDPHSVLIKASAIDNVLSNHSGTLQNMGEDEIAGIGIALGYKDGAFTVDDVFEDNPAALAGLKPGDRVVGIDGADLAALTKGLEEEAAKTKVVEALRGRMYAPVKLTVERQGSADLANYTVIRDEVRRKAAVGRIIAGDIAYLQLRIFNEYTNSDLLYALEKVQKESKGKITGYILDVRTNPGGHIDQAVAVVDNFIAQNGVPVVSTDGREKKYDTEYKTSIVGDVIHGARITVLIDGRAASASEIVSGSLQDTNRAKLIGTKTFGKGSAQTDVNFSNNDRIRLTTNYYRLNSGRTPQDIGNTPDILAAELFPSGAIMNGLEYEADKPHALPNPDLASGKFPQRQPEKVCLPTNNGLPTTNLDKDFLEMLDRNSLSPHPVACALQYLREEAGQASHYDTKMVPYSEEAEKQAMTPVKAPKP